MALSLEQAARKFHWPDAAPQSCELVLNYACNARCVFCYHPLDLPEFQRGEMPIPDVARRLYMERGRGAWIAYLIGGEITVRPDLPAIVSLARKIGYSCVQIVTNGLRLADPDYAARLVDAGANAFRISFHGPDERLHDSLVAVPGAFRKGMRAVENLQRLGVHVGSNTVVNRINYTALPATIERLVVGAGVANTCIIYGHYLGMMERNQDDLRVRYRDAVPFVREAIEIYRVRGIPIEHKMLSNFTPCIIPGYQDLIAEWRYMPAEGDDGLFIPEGARGGVCEMKAAQRLKADACGDCVYGKVCMGIETAYARMFGVDEFVALPERPEPFPLKPATARWEKV